MTNTMFNSCIQACSNCALVCEACASACLREENVQAMARCIELDRDCADMCALAARLMSRQSELAKSFVHCVQKFAGPAVKSVPSIRWITAKNARKPV